MVAIRHEHTHFDGRCRGHGMGGRAAGPAEFHHRTAPTEGQAEVTYRATRRREHVTAAANERGAAGDEGGASGSAEQRSPRRRPPPAPARLRLIFI